MSAASTLRAVPTLLRVGFVSAVAYRAELLVWVLSTTMPLIMLALWTAVARTSPVVASSGRTFDSKEFVAYFLSAFIVRQLTSSWAAWEMNFEVRSGALSMRLLRPMSPIVWYAIENIAAIPMRLIVAVPVAVIMVVVAGVQQLPKSAWGWGAFAASLLGAWLITLLVNVCIGSLSLYLQSSIKVMDLWLASYFLLSGYLFPLELLPSWLQTVVGYLPFRYQMGLPIEMLNSMHGSADAVRLLAAQWGFVVGLFVLMQLLWRGGLRRFSAFGG